MSIEIAVVVLPAVPVISFWLLNRAGSSPQRSAGAGGSAGFRRGGFPYAQ